MEKYYLIKPYTDKYNLIDKEMFYMSLMNGYKFNNNPINLHNLGIKENIYISLLDLPIIEISNNTTIIELSEDIRENYYKSENKDKNIENITKEIISSMDQIFLLKHVDNYFFCKLKMTTFTKSVTAIPIENFNTFYREQKIKSFFDED